MGVVQAILAGIEQESQAMRWIPERVANAALIVAGLALHHEELRRGPKRVRTVPEIGVMRTILLNHTCHHHGQLAVYP